ncbi:hypothetical protein BH09ACT8_BH09ACT8_50980 [soil metagenome]
MNEHAAKLTRWLLAGNGALKNVAQLLTESFGPTGAVAAAIDASTITAYPVDPGTEPQGQGWSPVPEGWTHPLHSQLLPRSISASHHVVVGITSRNQVLVVNLAAADYVGIEGDNPVLMMRSWLIQSLSKTPTADVAVTDPALAIPGAERLTMTGDPAAAAPTPTLIFSTHHTSPPPPGVQHPITVSSQAADAANVVLCSEAVAGIYLANRYWPVWRRMEIADEQWEHLKAVLVPESVGAGPQHLEQPAAERSLEVLGAGAPAAVPPQSLEHRIEPRVAAPAVMPLTSTDGMSRDPASLLTSPATSDDVEAVTSGDDTSPGARVTDPASSAAHGGNPASEERPEPPTPPAIVGSALPTSGNDTSPVEPAADPTFLAAHEVDAAPEKQLEPPAPPTVADHDPLTSENDTSPAVEADEPAAAEIRPPAPLATPPLLTPEIPAPLAAIVDDLDEYAGTDDTPLLPGRPAKEPTEPGLYVLGPVYALGVDPDTKEPVRHSAVTRQGVRKPVKALMALATSNGVTSNEWEEKILQVTPQNRRQLRTQIRKMMGGIDPIRNDTRGLLVVDMFCDWKEFNRLVGHSPESATTDALTAAVSLIRGTPFEDVPDEDYSWRSVQLLKDELIDRCSTAAAELAQRQQAAGARDAAYHTARLGLRVYAQREDLWLVAANSVTDTDRKALIWDLKHAIPVPTHPELRQLLAAARAS